MLSSILNSKRAIQVNIQIMRTFTRLREIMASHKESRTSGRAGGLKTLAPQRGSKTKPKPLKAVSPAKAGGLPKGNYSVLGLQFFNDN